MTEALLARAQIITKLREAEVELGMDVICVEEVVVAVGCKYSNDVQGTVPGEFGAGMYGQITIDGSACLVACGLFLSKTPSVRPIVVRAIHYMHVTRCHQPAVSPAQVTPAQGTTPMYANE